MKLRGWQKLLSMAVSIVLLISLTLGLSGCNTTKNSETTSTSTTTQSSQVSFGKTVIAYAAVPAKRLFSQRCRRVSLQRKVWMCNWSRWILTN